MNKLLHIKGSRTKVLSSLPTNSFGSDGDIVLSAIKGKGFYLCAKINGRWFVSNKLEDLKKMEKTSIRDLSVDKLKIKNTTLTKDKLNKPVGDLTFDVGGDIALSADGGNITMNDGTTTVFDFDVDGVNLKMMDDADTGDYFNILVAAAGDTTISTVDDDGTAANLTLDIDGDITLDSQSKQFYIGRAGTNYLHFDMNSNNFKIMHNANVNDYFNIGVDTEGATTISTVDADTTAAHLTLDIDGDIELNADGGDITFKDNTTTGFSIDISAGVINIPQDFKLSFGASANNDYMYGDGDEILISKNDGDMWTFKDSETRTEGPLKIREKADAVADTAGYGQLWVDTATPNELAFTDDAGTDIIGIGKYSYETKMFGYYGNNSYAWLPFAGYIFEGSSTTGRNEYQSFIAPYNGTIVSYQARSEIAQGGANHSFRVNEASDGTEIPGTLIYRKDYDPSGGSGIADDTVINWDFSSPSTGTDPIVLTKGRLYMIYVSFAAVSYDTNVTLVFKWDITS